MQCSIRHRMKYTYSQSIATTIMVLAFSIFSSHAEEPTMAECAKQGAGTQGEERKQIILKCLNPTGEKQEDKRTPIQRYHGDASGALMLCKMTLKLAILKGSAGQEQDEESNYRSCIEKHKKEAKTNLSLALKITKKAKAQEALKTYHVALVTALDGIAPGLDERKISYEQRQQSLEGRMTEAWARFEIEN